jgi:hypothetical protein
MLYAEMSFEVAFVAYVNAGVYPAARVPDTTTDAMAGPRDRTVFLAIKAPLV